MHYARKFYLIYNLNLKSREKEIPLFYFDKKAYLDNKYLRIHFKIATILVGIALFFSTLGNTANFFFVFDRIPSFIPIPQTLNNIIIIVHNIYIDFIANFSSLFSKILFVLNYLYIYCCCLQVIQRRTEIEKHKQLHQAYYETVS